MFISDEKLISAVLRRGWSPRTQRAFTSQYGALLRRALVWALGRKLGYDHMGSLGNYLQSLERGRAPTPGRGVPSHLLELAQDTWQAIWMEVFKEEGNTIVQYQRYVEKCERSGGKPPSLEKFLWWLPPLKVRQQLSRHKEIFNPVYSLHEDREDNLSLGDIVGGNEETPLPDLPLEDEVDFYWEALLRCGQIEPDEMAQALELPQGKEHLLCWACCRLKRKSRADSRENLIAFMAFFVSQRLPEREREPLPSRKNLSLLTLSGKRLRWEEDICKQVFKKNIRKDRIMNQIQNILMESPYRDWLEGGEA